MADGNGSITEVQRRPAAVPCSADFLLPGPVVNRPRRKEIESLHSVGGQQTYTHTRHGLGTHTDFGELITFLLRRKCT